MDEKNVDEKKTDVPVREVQFVRAHADADWEIREGILENSLKPQAYTWGCMFVGALVLNLIYLKPR